MPNWQLRREGNQIIIHCDGTICATPTELLASSAFATVVESFGRELLERDSPYLPPLQPLLGEDGDWREVVRLLQALAEHTLEDVVRQHHEWGHLLRRGNAQLLNLFVQALYDYWRRFRRFMVLRSRSGPGALDLRPYRSFHSTLEELTHVVRAAYRDIADNIVGNHPDVYRQLPAGCNVGFIAVPRSCPLPACCREQLRPIPLIRQVWMTPPMITDPPMNKREGEFVRVDEDPSAGAALDPEEWLCFPAQVGPVIVFIYFHQSFIDLGAALTNLFQLADEQQIAEGPDAVFLYGLAPERLARFGDVPTVFYETPDGKLVGAVPAGDRFGYFGYLKKMALTLHNIVMMKRGAMPFHGALARVTLRGGTSANVLLMGDTAAGKSESLEALRVMSHDVIRELRVIADDMGSIRLTEAGQPQGFGTEIGAFVRLDDLQQGYAFEQIDRAIIMSPHRTNARVVLPVTTIDEVLAGHGIDFVLYANNFELVDDEHPAIERFAWPEEALAVFRQGAAMAKGTTALSGLTHSYFANIFGPTQYRELHESIAEKVFQTLFDTGVYVGQLRTQLAIPGLESEGPERAARALLTAISERG